MWQVKPLVQQQAYQMHHLLPPRSKVHFQLYLPELLARPRVGSSSDHLRSWPISQSPEVRPSLPPAMPANANAHLPKTRCHGPVSSYSGRYESVAGVWCRINRMISSGPDALRIHDITFKT